MLSSKYVAKTVDSSFLQWKKFDNIFSRLDTICVPTWETDGRRDRRTDTGRQQRLRFRIASRGEKIFNFNISTVLHRIHINSGYATATLAALPEVHVCAQLFAVPVELFVHSFIRCIRKIHVGDVADASVGCCRCNNATSSRRRSCAVWIRRATSQTISTHVAALSFRLRPHQAGTQSLLSSVADV